MGAYHSRMSRWPDLSALEVLVAVVDHGSLSAAARALRIAQPNASRSVTRLEHSLGLPLLRRSTTGSAPTPEGLLVVEWARTLLGSADDLLSNARTLSHRGAGTIAVSASQTISEHLLPGWLAAFRALSPEVRVTLRVTNTAAVLEDLLVGGCDLGFIEGPIPRGAAHLATVGQDELVLVFSPGHPWARGHRAVGPEDLHDGVLVTRESGSGTRRVLDDALGRPVTPQLELGSNAAVRVAVLSGAGPAVLSRLAVAEAIAGGSLVEIPIGGVRLRRRLCAAWTGPRALGGPAGALVRIATEHRGSRVQPGKGWQD